MTEVYPDFVGQDKSKAIEFCKQYGCVVSIEEQADNSKTPGTIIAQSRSKGSDVVEGASLTVTVAKLDEKNLIPLDQGDSEEGSSNTSEGQSN